MVVVTFLILMNLLICVKKLPISSLHTTFELGVSFAFTY